jgi:hypothetical protein
MDQRLTKIKQCEARIEEVLWSLEVAGDNKGALEAYKAAEAELRALLADAAPSEMAETQRVLAYCLMREGNVLRATGHPDEAGRLSEEEIETARASGDSITLARSLMSHGTNLLVGGGPRSRPEPARRGESAVHVQRQLRPQAGLGMVLDPARGPDERWASDVGCRSGDLRCRERARSSSPD